MRCTAMDFKKLPKNSEKLLCEMMHTDNPVQLLSERFGNASLQEDSKLRAILRELREEGYINISWANDEPCFIEFNNMAWTYEERLSEHELQEKAATAMGERKKTTIFISHRSIDKTIADMLVDFFSGTGIPCENVFCSSLPGNDVKEKISSEVREALKNSAINIVILSGDYYQSAYCLNEAGVIWYLNNIPVITIALPEIVPENMHGFLNNEHKLRRLDSDGDISYIYDAVKEAVSAPDKKHSIITHQTSKLKSRYAELLKTRNTTDHEAKIFTPQSPTSFNTDDERIILYYILQNDVRKIQKSVLEEWLQDEEIYRVNVDNAFDLLSAREYAKADSEALELDIDFFNYLVSNKETLRPELEDCVRGHQELAACKFMNLWKDNSFDDTKKLFIAYIVDRGIYKIGGGWKSEEQINDINDWENEYLISSDLKTTYQDILIFLIKNELIYESDWTTHGNPREYSFCSSLKRLLLSCPSDLLSELNQVKQAYRLF